MVACRALLILSVLALLAKAEDDTKEEKKPCKTDDGKEVKIGEQYDKPGACYANICSGNDVFAVAECGIRGLPHGWVMTEVDPSKGYPGCCAEPVPPLDIIPDILDKLDLADTLEISYDNATVDMGNQLAPSQVKEQPHVNYTSDPLSHYLLAMVDPDVPSVINPEGKEFLHWLVGNIAGSDVPSADVLAEYVGSGPLKDTGIHRYVFLLYKQPGKLSFDEEKINKTTAQGRGRFSIKKFADKYKLGDPVALNVFQAEYDDSVPELLKQLGITADE